MTGQGVVLDVVAGTPTTGLWCDTCLLPSRYDLPFYALGADGPYRIGTFVSCEEHGA